jgi:hypothetical protein
VRSAKPARGALLAPPEELFDEAFFTPGRPARGEVIARESINIDSLEQEPHLPKDRVSFVITVEPMSEPVIRRAVNTINKFDFMVEPVFLLRIEE